MDQVYSIVGWAAVTITIVMIIGCAGSFLDKRK